MTVIDQYAQRFTRLRSDTSATRWSSNTCHRAPHKPLLLLAVMDLYAEGSITTNLIELTAALGELFTLYYAHTDPRGQRGNVALPFFHLRSEGFWHLVPKPNNEAFLVATRQIRSISQLHDTILGARLDEELYELFCDQESRNLLRTVLLESYFSTETQQALVEQGVVNLESFYYSRALLEKARTQQIEETSAGEGEYRPAARDQGFRRAVVTAYDHRCALCGIRMLTPDGHTAVDAAHIIPWSISRNDDPRNGISLCRLCHWTFDEGLVSISSRYQVVTSPQLGTGQNVPGHLLTLNSRGIIGPSEQPLWPDQKALSWHRQNVFRHL